MMGLAQPRRTYNHHRWLPAARPLLNGQVARYLGSAPPAWERFFRANPKRSNWVKLYRLLQQY